MYLLQSRSEVCRIRREESLPSLPTYGISGIWKRLTLNVVPMLTQCSYSRLLSNHQTWSTATAILSRTYYTRPRSPHLPFSVRMKIKNRHSVSASPDERPIDRYAREAFTGVLHDMLKDKCVPGLTDREDTYVFVRELVRYSFHFLLVNKTYNVHLVESPTSSNIILFQSLKRSQRGLTPQVWTASSTSERRRRWFMVGERFVFFSVSMLNLHWIVLN